MSVHKSNAFYMLLVFSFSQLWQEHYLERDCIFAVVPVSLLLYHD